MDILDIVPQDARARMGWDQLDDSQRTAIAEFGLSTYRFGAACVANIDEVKYDGRLVVLDDGTRWEVDRYDADRDVQFWNMLDEVIVYEDTMYNVEHAERASVSEE